MPRAKKDPNNPKPTSKPEPKAPEMDWGGFLNLRLTEEHKADFDAWHEASRETIGVLLDDAMIDGLKVSIAYSPENEAYCATFTGQLIPAHNTRYAASSWAGTWQEAVALMCWKHFVLAQGSWFDFLPHSGKLKRWG